jgi:hypothetical protein
MFEGTGREFDDALRRLQVHMLVHIFQKLSDIEGQLASLQAGPEDLGQSK